MKNTNYLKIAAAGTAAFMISAATGNGQHILRCGEHSSGFRIHISKCYPRGLRIYRGLRIHSLGG